jgi:hypothetical protein
MWFLFVRVLPSFPLLLLFPLGRVVVIIQTVTPTFNCHPLSAHNAHGCSRSQIQYCGHARRERKAGFPFNCGKSNVTARPVRNSRPARFFSRTPIASIPTVCKICQVFVRTMTNSQRTMSTVAGHYITNRKNHRNKTRLTCDFPCSCAFMTSLVEPATALMVAVSSY